MKTKLDQLLDDKAPPRFDQVDALISEFVCISWALVAYAKYSRLRQACETTILADFEYASNKGVERHLWDSHIKINQRYRKIVEHYRKDDQRRNIVERRKLEKRYADFIKTSQFFYKGYIQRLASRFEGLKELRRIAHRLSLDTQAVDQRVSVSPEVERLIDSSCHHLG